MPCDTAKRWFVPDQEDYALVNIPEAEVRANINQYDNAIRGLPAREQYFSHYLKNGGGALYNEIFSPSSCPLIYADVDDTKHEHKQMLREKAIQEDLCQPNADFASLREKFITALVDGHEPNPCDDPTRESEGELRAHYTSRFDAYILNSNVVEDDTARLLFELDSAQDQQHLLEMISGQHLKKTARPVMLLICMIDTHQTTTYGCTEGYAAAIDVPKNLLIIRPFRSDKDTHPLTQPWTSNVPDDGISIACSSSSFVSAYTVMASNLENEHDDFKLMVYSQVIQYFLKGWNHIFNFYFLKPESAAKVRTQVEEADAKVWERLSRTPFPVKAKEWLLPPGGLVGFRDLQQVLECMEPELRKEAVKAKSDGDDQVAENAAMVFERIMKLIKDFNADPSGEAVME
ncbi:hypothetical protein G7Y79_00026g059550 [Physcia stellaris]|nr:hypothetical protein G7Y79_00026g059550 [Physcia stellaris]